MTSKKEKKPYVDDDGIFHYDSVDKGIWYAMHPKSGLGARAISTTTSLIEKFNESYQTERKTDSDFITSFTPTYRAYREDNKIVTRYVFSNIIFVHTTPSTLFEFMQAYPYQLFFMKDRSVTQETNFDEYGNATHDTYMRIKTKGIRDLYLTLNTYNEEIKVFTASQLQEMKYTRKVEIVDGPLAGQVCRIKTIEGKKRVIVELFDGLIGMALVIPTTHFKKV